MIFVDTSFWAALRQSADSHHAEAESIFVRLAGKPLTTSNHVVGETWTFLQRRGGRAAALDFLDRVEAAERLRVVRVTERLEREAWTWLRRHDEREYSFVDATSRADAFAADPRGAGVRRRLHRGGFRRAAAVTAPAAATAEGGDRYGPAKQAFHVAAKGGAIGDVPRSGRATRGQAKRGLAGIGLLWVALLASAGLLWLALGALVVTALGVIGVLARTWKPRLNLRAFRRRVGRRLASARAAVARGVRSASSTTRTGAMALLAWLRRADEAAGVRVKAAWAAATRTTADAGGRARRTTAAAGGRAKVLSAKLETSAVAAGASGRSEGRHARPVTSSHDRARRAGAKDESTRRSPLARQAVRAFRAENDQRGEALALNTLALALAQQGNYLEAVDSLDGALTLLGELGDRHREGTVLVNLGTLHRQVGGVQAARFCWNKALERLDPASPESHETERLLRAS